MARIGTVCIGFGYLFLGSPGAALAQGGEGGDPPPASASAPLGGAVEAEPKAAVGESEPPAAAESESQPGPSPAAASGEEPAEVSDEAYNLRLRSIEERVNQLKEKIFQSKARLIQLQEVVLHGTISGSKAILVHKNEMGSSFRLRRVQYSLDGAPIFNRVATSGDELEEQEEVEIFNGAIAPGNHQISVYLEYNGHGYGIFSYLKGYTFKIKSSQTFTAEEGKLTTIRIVGYEKGGLTTELKDRPSVRYDFEVTREIRGRQSEESNAGAVDGDSQN